MTHRTALVTGASRGIGATGGRAEAIVHDVRYAHGTARCVRELDARALGLDLVIANAGVAASGWRSR